MLPSTIDRLLPAPLVHVVLLAHLIECETDAADYSRRRYRTAAHFARTCRAFRMPDDALVRVRQRHQDAIDYELAMRLVNRMTQTRDDDDETLWYSTLDTQGSCGITPLVTASFSTDPNALTRGVNGVYVWVHARLLDRMAARQYAAMDAVRNTLLKAVDDVDMSCDHVTFKYPRATSPECTCGGWIAKFRRLNLYREALFRVYRIAVDVLFAEDCITTRRPHAAVTIGDIIEEIKAS